MGQSRNKTGVDFEKMICETKGWSHTPASPKIIWTGVGRTNFDKIASVGFDASKFLPTSESTFEKFDTITPNGEKVELKKYKTSKAKKWTAYSEPIFKVASKNMVEHVTLLFGKGNLSLAQTNYNKFVSDMFNYVGQDILDNITRSNIGIQLEDGFVPQSNLEYRWRIKKGWKGFNRLSIEFRIKD